MGILRAIWDHRASLSDTPLGLHIPDPALVKSLRSPPAIFSSEVTEWLHAKVHLLLSPLVSIQHSAPVPTLPAGCTPTELGMHLAQSNAHTGISPLSSGSQAPEAPFSGALIHDPFSLRLLSCGCAPGFLVLAGPLHGGPPSVVISVFRYLDTGLRCKHSKHSWHEN